MRRLRFDILRRLLLTALCALLFVYCTPTVLAFATGPSSTADGSTFFLHAEANGYSSSAKVSFVDADKNPLNGTVTGSVTRSYTGTGPESNETNTIDMYQFQGMIDPKIADEYDFSRVYVQLEQGTGDQKNFRYMQVGDETAITPSGNTFLYRGYLYQTSIDECNSGQDYYGAWYDLEADGAMDPIFIEFNHVAEASFNALDTRGKPVEGAQFALYSDSCCSTPYEYKDEPVVATSNESGRVSFGKIPRGTYYMKETVAPNSYKMSTQVYTIVVDGNTPIADVIHQDDDGSVPIADATHRDDGSELITDTKKMMITKKWDDGEKSHVGDSVEVAVYEEDAMLYTVPLNAENDWSATLDGLDPNKTYMIVENKVIVDGREVTSDWVSHVAIDEKDSTTEYCKVDALQEGEQYILLTPIQDDEQICALSGDSNLTTLPLEVLEGAITGDVSTDMLWTVDRITQDGVDATSFDIYRKVNAKTLDITITNKTTTYPIQFMNATYPNKTALPGMKFDLYTQMAYDADERGEPFQQSLVAGDDGILKAPDDESTFELRAGSYCLVQTEGLGDYPPLEQPVRFTITRGGALNVSQASQEVRDFAYSSTTTDGKLLLQIPHFKPATVEMLFQVQGDYADLAKEFEFQLAVPEGVGEIEACIDDTPVTLSTENNTVALSHGQSLKLMNIPDSESYELTQTDALVAQSSEADSGCYSPQLQVVTANTANAALKQDDARVLTLSELKGTETSPAKVTITNTQQGDKAPITGIDIDDSPWLAMVFASAAVLCALWLLQKRRHKTMMQQRHKAYSGKHARLS